MQKVLGIGGVFFRCSDPAAMGAWYATHLGVDEVPDSYDQPSWHQESGSTVFAPFAADTTYFGQPTQQWMINFRVTDLDGMVRQLEAQGIAVERDPETYPNGLFARLEDPEGNPIQLWQEI